MSSQGDWPGNAAQQVQVKMEEDDESAYDVSTWPGDGSEQVSVKEEEDGDFAWDSIPWFGRDVKGTTSAGSDNAEAAASAASSMGLPNERLIRQLQASFYASLNMARTLVYNCQRRLRNRTEQLKASQEPDGYLGSTLEAFRSAALSATSSRASGTSTASVTTGGTARSLAELEAMIPGLDEVFRNHRSDINTLQKEWDQAKSASSIFTEHPSGHALVALLDELKQHIVAHEGEMRTVLKMREDIRTHLAPIRGSQ